MDSLKKVGFKSEEDFLEHLKENTPFESKKIEYNKRSFKTVKFEEIFFTTLYVSEDTGEIYAVKELHKNSGSCSYHVKY